MRTINNKTISITGILLLLFLFISCEDFVEVPQPVTELGTPLVFNSDEGARAAMNGVYIKMMDNFGHFANKNTTIFAGLSADEFENHKTDPLQAAFYENTLTPENSNVSGLWRDAYTTIYRVNAVLKGLEGTAEVSDPVRNRLKGEALFIRAFSHFYLTGFFGAVPYVTTTDYNENAAVSAVPADELYLFIEDDLKESRRLLSADYAFSAGQRIRPDYYAATALLARVYLYKEDWNNAVQMAGEVIGQGGQYRLLEDLDAVFLADSQEAIWQLQPVVSGLNTIEGYSITCCVSTNISLTQELISTFAEGDLRRDSWVAQTSVAGTPFYYPFKYKVTFSSQPEEYYMVLRLAEQYLIRAEANAHLNKLQPALEDLNAIRNRAGLENVSVSTREELLDAIYRERQRELFAEWGHRWFDLKRTANVEVLDYKPGWEATDALYPIPQSEIVLNPNLIQNPGY